jgi:hypothetical protein
LHTADKPQPPWATAADLHTRGDLRPLARPPWATVVGLATVVAHGDRGAWRLVVTSDKF